MTESMVERVARATADELAKMTQIERVKNAIRAKIGQWVVIGEFALADIARAAIAAMKDQDTAGGGGTTTTTG